MIKISLKKFLKKIPARKADANKGDFGHLLIIGSDHGMAGAVIMAAEGACRVGAGKVSVLTHRENFSPLIARLPNVMTPTNLDLENKTALVLGCGLGQSNWSHEMFNTTINSNLPKIIDADALNILSKNPQKLTNTIITPHAAEAARLLGITTQEVQQNRQTTIKKLYEKYGAITVLKGHETLIYNGSEIYISPYGNPGMATAGMGDLLSGIIGGFLAQKLSLIDSAILGVALHGKAGDLTAKTQSPIGMIPSDLSQYILKILK